MVRTRASGTVALGRKMRRRRRDSATTSSGGSAGCTGDAACGETEDAAAAELKVDEAAAGMVIVLGATDAWSSGEASLPSLSSSMRS